MKEFNELKINKKINSGLIKKHPIIDELLNTTPIFIDKDSIKQSLALISLSRAVNSYEPEIPGALIDDYIKVKKNLKRVKPLSTNLNLASLNNGFAFTGQSVNQAREGFKVKHWAERNAYYFTKTGAPFYTLGGLGRLCIALNDLWNH